MLTIIIPARNEAENLREIPDLFNQKLKNIEFEVLLINDFSEDNTFSDAQNLFSNYKNYRVLNNKDKGLGGAINLGIREASGSKISIVMADLSDDLDDLVEYNKIIDQENLDAVLGSRFIKGSVVQNYPLQKLVLNRIFNLFVSLLFWNKYNDYTNAFKIYKKEVLIKIMPLVSESFNIFLEIPLKIISRKYNYKVIRINWYGRKKGQAKFKIKELGSKYLFTLIYCFIEKNLLNIKK